MRTLGWIGVMTLVGACSSGEPSAPAGDSPSAALEPSAHRTNPEAEAKPGSRAGSGPGAKSTSAREGAPVPERPPPRGEGEVEPEGSEPSNGAGEVEPATPAPAAEPMPVELRAADGVIVHGLSYAAVATEPRPIVLLFHQAGSNAAEYGPIAPRLQALGYHALAIDQRSGKRRFGRDNLTVKARGESTGFGPAYRDLVAALDWAHRQSPPAILVWGSSYSAALVFRLAAERGDQLAAVLAFSPGEYMGAKGKVAGWAAEVEVPVFITSAPGKEVEGARAIAQAVGERAEQHVPSHGVHGSSTLHPSRNPSGHREVWTAVEAFLQRVAP